MMMKSATTPAKIHPHSIEFTQESPEYVAAMGLSTASNKIASPTKMMMTPQKTAHPRPPFPPAHSSSQR
jgi:hypothetical protein